MLSTLTHQGTATTIAPDRLSCAVTGPCARPRPFHPPHMPLQRGWADRLAHAPSRRAACLPTTRQMGSGTGAGFRLPRGNASMSGGVFEEIWAPSHRWSGVPESQRDVWSACIRRGDG